VHLLAKMVARATRRRISEHSGILVRKLVVYVGYVVLVMMVLNQLGFKLTALLGAAGIAGIAIGFAAQTSVSNVISGIFLLSEKPFQVGDLITVGGTTGVVMSIDLLSIKLRKLDNLFVRIPNETIIKTELINITRFPIRRMDIDIGVAYKEDVGKVRAVLEDVAARNPYCLDEPAPLILFKNFGNSALEFLYGLWFYKTDYLALRNSIMQEVKERFDAEGIEIPFPHQSLYAGEATKPFPIRLVGDSLPPEVAGEIRADISS
jgi:small-conductance mechanosensitive channel